MTYLTHLHSLQSKLPPRFVYCFACASQLAYTLRALVVWTRWGLASAADWPVCALQPAMYYRPSPPFISSSSSPSPTLCPVCPLDCLAVRVSGVSATFPRTPSPTVPSVTVSGQCVSTASLDLPWPPSWRQRRVTQRPSLRASDGLTCGR